MYSYTIYTIDIWSVTAINTLLSSPYVIYEYTMKLTCYRYTPWYHSSSLFYNVLGLWHNVMWVQVYHDKESSYESERMKLGRILKGIYE